MNQLVSSSSSSTTELRRRRAADEILIAAIYGLSERDEPTTATSTQGHGTRRSMATAAAPR